MNIAFREPVKTIITANVERSPRSLYNAYLDKLTGFVKASTLELAAPSLNPGVEPYWVWNGKLLSGPDGIEAADRFNQLLYASHTSNGIIVYPSDYDGTNQQTVVPHITSVGHTVQAMSGYSALNYGAGQSTTGQINAVVGYILIPFTSRDEAGPWVYYGFSTGYLYNDQKTDADGNKVGHARLGTIDLSFSVAGNVSYIDVYRTTESVVDRGAVNTALYYLGRFNRSGGGASFRDDKLWWAPGHVELLREYAKKSEIAEVAKLVETGRVDAGQVAIPSRTLSRAINLHAQDYTSSAFNGNASAKGLAIPKVIRAKTMVNYQGSMLYGEVTWPLKTPQVMAYEAETNLDTIAFQYEYEFPSGTVYGPVLSCTNVKKVLIAWQGEQALLIYKNGILRERIVTDEAGRYISSYGVPDPLFGLPTVSYWTYDQRATNTLTGGTQSATLTVTENNVVFMSAQDRPWEITTDQFYLPDNSRIVDIWPASLQETEAIKSYDVCIGTEDSVFVYQLDLVNRRAIPQERIPVGLAESPFNRGVTSAIKNASCFVGNDGHLYMIVGRRAKEMDLEVDGLWSSIYDIGYHPKNGDLYIATNTGIWVWDFDVYNGIYKHIHFGEGGVQSQNVNLDYIKGTVEGTAYDDMVAYSSVGPAGGFLLERGSVATDTKVKTQPIRSGENAVRVAELRVTHDGHPKVGTYTVALLTPTQIDLTGTNNASFSQTDVGKQILLSGAGVGGVALKAKIATYVSATQVTIDRSVSTAVTDGQCVWGILDVKHMVKYRGNHEQNFVTYCGARRFPKLGGLEHQFEFSNFQSLEEVDLFVREM